MIAKEEVIRRLYEALDSQLNYFIIEYTITYGDIISILEELKFDYMAEAKEEQ